MIDPKTGVVNVSRALDISESERYSLLVEVSDGLLKGTVSFHTIVIFSLLALSLSLSLWFPLHIIVTLIHQIPLLHLIIN